MKKLLSIFLFALMASSAAVAQEDICSVVNTIMDEAKGLVNKGKNADALALLRAAQAQPELRSCTDYGLLSEEIQRIETNQDLVIPVNDSIFITMIKVESGTFTMGATSEQESDAFDSEKPAHSVTLSDYYIGQTEVTQALWQVVMGSNPSNFKGSNLSVVNVSWSDCQQFITKLNQLTGRRFRLPTEAEWEYAARGGSKSHGYKYSGSNNLGSVAWYIDNSGWKKHPVVQKQANELGIYDMSGNVREWCQDWYDSGYYGKSPSTNPCNNTSAYGRVCRGGSLLSHAGGCRVSIRSFGSPGNSGNDLGLRLAM